MNPGAAPQGADGCDSATDIGQTLHAMIRRLHPICRSITGDGVRQSLAILNEQIPLTVHEVPSGMTVFDWTVPKEWNIRDAYVKDASGRRVIDFQVNNLHVVSYSAPVRRRMSKIELLPHLHTLPDYPDWIPYRTSYYKESWGFCLSHRQLAAFPEGEYEVCIDSTLTDGSLTYGECFIAGEYDDEVLLYAHICHPSLCNDNLSGIAVATLLARELKTGQRRYSYRVVFAPATIGAITWLAMNRERLGRIRHGLVLTLLGDTGAPTYKKSRRGDAPIDRIVAQVLHETGRPFTMEEFSPYGYDERQFCSPGINLPVGRLTRTPHGRFPEYHTSADDLGYVRPEALADSYAICRAAMTMLEQDARYRNTAPMGEPQLGRRGLYRKTSADVDVGKRDLALLWTLNLSDGEHALLDIAQRARLPFDVIRRAADDLVEAGLLTPVASA